MHQIYFTKKQAAAQLSSAPNHPSKLQSSSFKKGARSSDVFFCVVCVHKLPHPHLSVPLLSSKSSKVRPLATTRLLLPLPPLLLPLPLPPFSSFSPFSPFPSFSPFAPPSTFDHVKAAARAPHLRMFPDVQQYHWYCSSPPQSLFLPPRRDYTRGPLKSSDSARDWWGDGGFWEAKAANALH